MDLKGKIKPNKILRVGEVGDPAIDWQHSNQQIAGVLSRSPGVTPERNLFAITKLQNIEGFNPKIWRNLEVSLDPLMPEHLQTTMQNIVKLKQMDPSLNIVARIRSYKSNNPKLQQSLETALEFTDKMDLPVLETKLRFKNKEYLDILDIDKSAYKAQGAQQTFEGKSILEEMKPSAKDRITVCGEGATKGQCLTCRGCEKLATQSVPKDWQPTESYLRDAAKKGFIADKDLPGALRNLKNMKP